MDIIILQYSSSTVFYIHTTFHHHHPYLDRSPGWSSLPSSRTIPHHLLVSTHKVYPSSPIPPTILPTNDSDDDDVSIITLHYHNDDSFFIPSSYYINININAALPSGVPITTTATTNTHCSITLSDYDSE